MIERVGLIVSLRLRVLALNPNSEFGLGGTGYQPVPSGHWPDGMTGTPPWGKGAVKSSGGGRVPSGGSPLGTGGSPVLPGGCAAATSEQRVKSLSLARNDLTPSVAALYKTTLAMKELGINLAPSRNAAPRNHGTTPKPPPSTPRTRCAMPRRHRATSFSHSTTPRNDSFAWFCPPPRPAAILPAPSAAAWPPAATLRRQSVIIQAQSALIHALFASN